MDEENCAVLAFAPISECLERIRRENYSETLLLYKEARKRNESSQKSSSQETAWAWKTLGPLPRDLGPPPVFMLPKPPQIRVLLEVDSDTGSVAVSFCVAIDDIEIPGGLFTGLDDIPIPVPGTYRRGDTFYPAPEAYLQVQGEGEWIPDDDFEPPPDLPYPPWHYRQFCSLPEAAPATSAAQSEPWVHPYLRDDARGRRDARGRGMHDRRRDAERQRRSGHDSWTDGSRGRPRRDPHRMENDRFDRDREFTSRRAPLRSDSSPTGRERGSLHSPADQGDVWAQPGNDEQAMAAWNGQQPVGETDFKPAARDDREWHAENGDRQSDGWAADRHGRDRHPSPRGRRPYRARGRFFGSGRERRSPVPGERDDRRHFADRVAFHDDVPRGRGHEFRERPNRYPGPRRPHEPFRGRRPDRGGPRPGRREWRHHEDDRRYDIDPRWDNHSNEHPDRRQHHRGHEGRRDGIPRRDWAPRDDRQGWSRGGRQEDDRQGKTATGMLSYPNAIPVGSESPKRPSGVEQRNGRAFE